MEKTCLFYDIETTGLNKAFDQIIQFAAIRTDPEMNELERHEIFIRLNPDTVPTPQAMVTHQIPLEQIQQGISEFEAIEKIHALVNQPGTTSLGYNTLGYDDEFLRFSFFRNLLPPYSHQYANNCGRMDIYPAAIMFYLFKPEVMKWPTVNGKVSLKLENLNQENNLAQGEAHNAMVDVEATLALARRFHEEREMCNYILGYFDKEIDHQRIGKLTAAFNIAHHSFKQGIMVQGSFGADNMFQSVVLCLGRHNHYKNQTLWLRLDHIDFEEIANDELIKKTWVCNKKPGEPGLLLPTVKRFMIHINEQRQALVDKNLAWIQSHLTQFQQIIDHHRDYTHPKISNVDPDASLYQIGFLLPHETQLCQKFHQVDLEQKVQMLDQFHNPTLREQAIRIIGRSNRDLLKKSHLYEFENYITQINSTDEKQIPIDYRGERRLTPKKALAEISHMLEEGNYSEHQQTLLSELEDHIAMQFANAAEPAM